MLLAVIPFTLIVIFPTNKQILNPSLDKNSELASQLLSRWGRLHAVRSILSLLSFLIFIFAWENSFEIVLSTLHQATHSD